MKVVIPKERQWAKCKGYFKKILLDEKELKSKGNLLQIVKAEKGSVIKPHYHKKTSEIFYILKGKGILFVGNDRTRRKHGDVIFCEPGELHGVINDTEREFVWLVFKINARKNDTFFR